MMTELEKKIYGKSKLKTKLRGVRNFLLGLLGVFFIAVAFGMIIDINGAIGDGLKNVRYGLFSSALVISGTALILGLLYKSRK
jgi:hypothetical protein